LFFVQIFFAHKIFYSNNVLLKNILEKWIFYKKGDLHERKGTRSAHDKWRAMVLENFLEVVSLSVTCRKGKQWEDEEGERSIGGGWAVSVFPIFFRFVFFSKRNMILRNISPNYEYSSILKPSRLRS
jgi:hypothetical protein